MCNTIRKFYQLTVLNCSAYDKNDIRAKIRILRNELGYNPFRVSESEREVTVCCDSWIDLSCLEDAIRVSHPDTLFCENQY